MKITSALIMSFICIQLYACKNSNAIEAINNSNSTANTDTMKLKLTVGTHIFTATLQNNATVAAFKATLPMSINMNELNGNEKYFDLTNNLPAKASNPVTIHAGDLMLYGSNTLVLFYKTFSTSYNYTRIARIDNTSGLEDAFGLWNIAVKFELQ